MNYTTISIERFEIGHLMKKYFKTAFPIFSKA